MKRTYVVAGMVVAVAVLLPLGKWILASRQDAADEKASQEVERRFASRQASAALTGQPQAGGGQWGPGRSGRSGQWRGRQGGGQRGQDRARRMQEMVKAVGLNPAQLRQIQVVQQSSRPMMSDVFRNPQLTREQKMAAVQQIRQAQQAQIGKILTPDQQTKYAAFQQTMRQRRQTRRQDNGGTGGGPLPGGQD